MPAPAAETRDPVALAQALIRHASVTPTALPRGDAQRGYARRCRQGLAGALDCLEGLLAPLGFACTRLAFGAGAERVDNLYARRGGGAPHFCFAGHVDVVPPGSAEEWSVAPFAGSVRDGQLLGRGAVDMKGAIAAFVHALAQRPAPARGSVSLLITGDEEGPAVNGTAKMLGWLRDNGHVIDDCLVGEPTCRARLGDTIKIGRRGSLNLRLQVRGAAGHAAYPESARNPLPVLADMIAQLSRLRLDEGTDHFQPSSLTCTSVDTGNPAANVIPGAAQARLNIRFNDLHDRAGLEARLRAALDAAAAGTGCSYRLEGEESGRPFLGRAEALADMTAAAVRRRTGLQAQLSTGGGTSDARFIRAHARVVEFGLVGASMHQADERVAVDDLHTLSKIYADILEAYFAAGEGEGEGAGG